jgi:hypothetical protein
MNDEVKTKAFQFIVHHSAFIVSHPAPWRLLLIVQLSIMRPAFRRRGALLPRARFPFSPI